MCKECGCGTLERFGVHPMQAPPEHPVRLIGPGDDAGAGESDPAGRQGGDWHRHADGTVHRHAHDAHDHDHNHDHNHNHGQPGVGLPSQGDSPGDGAGSAVLESALPLKGEALLASLVVSRTLEIGRPVLDRNGRLAERNRACLREHGLTSVNLVSSPGSGKTTLVEKTVAALAGTVPTAVIVGDLATARDAERIKAAGAPVVQITTGTACHLDAAMVARGIESLDLKGCRLLLIENVGNLVCPADFDLGEDRRVVLLSVTEGEDKPLKYPPIFRWATAVVVTKLDLAEATGVDMAQLRINVATVAPRAQVFELSAKTGVGMTAWLEWLGSGR